MAFHEKTYRSIVKALTFRFFVLIADGIIIFAITHRYDIAFGVILLSNVSSTLLYFLHERIWNGVHWGKRRLELVNENIDPKID